MRSSALPLNTQKSADLPSNRAPTWSTAAWRAPVSVSAANAAFSETPYRTARAADTRRSWGRSGLEFSSEIPEVEVTDYRVQEVNDRYLATIDFINENLRDPGFSMVDARTSEQYTGEKAGTRFGGDGDHRNKGHIYGARNVVWSDNFNEDGTYKSLEELRELYAPHGVTDDKTVVTYCNVGILGSSPWFVLSELLGYEDVRLYDASMTEWANDDENYMVMGKHCM